jgi:hypothetical protein
MAKTQVKNKTAPTEADVQTYLDAVAPEWKQEDAKTIAAMMERLSGHKPKMWGPTMVGYGQYHYVYDSGREGDMMRTGFSARKTALTLYCIGGFEDKEKLLAKLGKHSLGKSCLYVKRLSDIDLDVLEEIIVKDLEYMAEKYPE